MMGITGIGMGEFKEVLAAEGERKHQCAVREQCAKEVEQEAERLREMSRKPFLSDADRERLCVRYMQLFDMAVQLRIP